MPEVDLPFVPLHDKVVIKEFEAPDKTEGGIFLPDSTKKWPARGEILAISTDVIGEYAAREQSCPFEVGSIIVYDKYSGSQVRVNSTNYLFLPYTDIYGVIKKNGHVV